MIWAVLYSRHNLSSTVQETWLVHYSPNLKLELKHSRCIDTKYKYNVSCPWILITEEMWNKFFTAVVSYNIILAESKANPLFLHALMVSNKWDDEKNQGIFFYCFNFP